MLSGDSSTCEARVSDARGYEGPGRKPHPRHIGGRSVLSGGPFSGPGGTARPSRSRLWVESGSPSQHVFAEATFRLGF